MNFLDERLPDRFWNKVQPCPMSGCWLWTATKTEDGYGRFYVERKRGIYAHRVTHAAAFGPLSDGLEIDHLCRNRACCNPLHLEAVTHRENVARGTIATKTQCDHGHVFDEQNTYLRKNGTRACRQCHARRQTARTQPREQGAMQ